MSRSSSPDMLDHRHQRQSLSRPYNDRPEIAMSAAPREPSHGGRAGARRNTNNSRTARPPDLDGGMLAVSDSAVADDGASVRTRHTAPLRRPSEPAPVFEGLRSPDGDPMNGFADSMNGFDDLPPPKGRGSTDSSGSSVMRRVESGASRTRSLRRSSGPTTHRPNKVRVDNSVAIDDAAASTHRSRRSSMESQRSRVNSNDDYTDGASGDVCFPIHSESEGDDEIDFEEMEEYLAQQRQSRHRQRRSSTFHRMRNYSMGKSERPVEVAMLRDHFKAVAPMPSRGAASDGPSTTATVTPTVADEAEKRNSPADGSTGPSSASAEEWIGEKLDMSDSRSSSFVPDRFSLFRSREVETIHAQDFEELLQNGDDGESSVRALFGPEHGSWWLDVLSPSDAEMKMLVKAFSIHPLTAEDIRVQETREKIELFKNYYFITFRSFVSDRRDVEYLEPLNMYIVVFKGGVLTFHYAMTSHPANVRRRIRQLRDYVNVTPDWISYALIDNIVDEFVPQIGYIEHETEAIEDDVLLGRTDENGELLRRLGECRQNVLQMYRLLYGKADVIKMFAKRCNEHWDVAPTSEIGLFLGDIQDHVVTMTSSLSQFEKILARSHSNYLAYLSVDAIRGNNRINELLGRVTLLGTVLVPMNVVTGLFGMNVRVPGEGVQNLGWFFGVLGLIVLIALAALLFSRKINFSGS